MKKLPQCLKLTSWHRVIYSYRAAKYSNKAFRLHDSAVTHQNVSIRQLHGILSIHFVFLWEANTTLIMNATSYTTRSCT